MPRKIAFVGIFALVFAGLAMPVPASAISFVSGYMNPTCTDVAINLTYNVNRDNTGAGAEHYAQIVTDGYGTVLAIVQYADNFSGTDNYTVPYFMAAPAGNPITAKLISYAGNGLGEDTYYTSNYECPGLPWVFQGPGIPSGFVLHTITCDVAIFATAGGILVPSDERILAGQTWFVNPAPVDGPDGQLWTEIFVSGYINGYIPTACVGGSVQ
jgi:hypothetical protein